MFVKKLFHFLVILWISTVVVSCDKPGMPYPDGIMGDGSIEALVLNEGLINTNAGAISVIYKDGGVVVDAFQDVNHRPMGDVAQSITLINGKYFVAMNNSKKIEIIDPVTFKSVGTILYTQAGYPRQVVPISSTEAVVSDLNRQLVRIRTVAPYGKPLEYISIPRWVEYLVVAENKVFGMTQGGLYVFDADNIKKDHARVIKEVYNEEYTKTCQLLVDKEGMIWGLMNQKRDGAVTGVTLKCVDPKREKVVKSYTLPFGDPNSQTPGEVIGYINYNRTDIDPTGTWIYFNVKTRSVEKNGEGVKEQQSVYRMNVETGEFNHYYDLPEVRMMYGFAVSPEGDVYLCDCLDYTAQRGYVRHYLKDGTKISHKVGVYPSQVYFPGSQR